MLTDIIQNWYKYSVEENFVGIGSTRKVYRVSDYVVKLHIHPIGYKQSLNELDIYNAMVEQGLHELFAKTYYVDEYVSIQDYYKPVAMRDNQSFEIDIKRENIYIPSKYEEAMSRLDNEFDCFDIKDSSNYGLNKENKLVFIDYGMSKKLYENEWVELAESGILPQIHFTNCSVCGLKKELRMYGEHDGDNRCYDCGKE
ncbi:protein kinase [Ornithinibacillus salinisoli]|uniref:Protein kinase n=1 Tax=Ornithinibacillus salinisoli TaxID=1848459 RepID=A0ABW4W238_9BACI